MDEPLLRGEELVKQYPLKRALLTGRVLSSLTAVDHVSLSLMPGETLGIVGESGSGKSTTGELLGGLQKPTSGRVLYRGTDIARMTKEEHSRYRRNVQFIFQDPKGALNPNARIGDSIAEPLITLGLDAGADSRRQKVLELLREVGLEESVLRKFPSELSGGQCQRVVIARALITQPEIIICDEAVSALDVSVQAQILNLLKDLQKKFGMSYLFISHDISVVSYMTDRIAVMLHGRLIEEARTEELIAHPKQAYTAQLIACANAEKTGAAV